MQYYLPETSHNFKKMNLGGFLRARSNPKSQTAKVLKDFCESTSLHGYSYLYLANSIFMKCLWSFVILIATGFGIGFLVNNTKAYFEATIVTNIESASANLSVSNLVKYTYHH